MSNSREASFQDELKSCLEANLKYRFSGIEFSKVERDYPVSGREADLVVFLKDRPFLVIETKRKRLRGGSSPVFQPLSVPAVGQAIAYAALWEVDEGIHVPYFGAADPEGIVIFRTPEKILDYVDLNEVRRREYEKVLKPGKYTELLNTALVMVEKVETSQRFAYSILERIVSDYTAKGGRARPTQAVLNLLREFVNRLSSRSEPLIALRLKESSELRKRVEELERNLGCKLSSSALARMMAYVFMNKIVFYKVLEDKYRLPRMAMLDTSSVSEFMRAFRRYSEKAMEITGDFEPIFSVHVYDMIELPDDQGFLESINDFIETIEEFRPEDILDLLGYVYEELIPPEERHQLGQFYTPPGICELITKWCIRGSDDIVFDPGCGSGGFILSAYRELLIRKTGKPSIPPPPGIHEKILSQLYALDINPFPAHITAIGVSMKDPASPSTNLNILSDLDFFRARAGMEVFSPYIIKTVQGDVRRKIRIPICDAVVGNPPYTRWVEIPEATQKAIKDAIGKKIKEYNLTPRLSMGIEPGIYVYWVMHATDFLKEGSRLGMIISNLWMQTDYGINFGNFLLDNYKVKAIVDFTMRLFTALTSTCVVLLERESDTKEREKNEIVFIHIPGTINEVNVNEILKVIEEKRSERLYIRTIRQGSFPRDRKWVDVFFDVPEWEGPPQSITLGELFEVSRGNTLSNLWALSHGKRPDIGASEFVYLTKSKVEEYGLQAVSYPNARLEEALIWPNITSARDVPFFTYREEDWKRAYSHDERCLMFIGHRSRKEMPKEVLEYIKRGEPVCSVCGKGLKPTSIAEGKGFFKCPDGHLIPIQDKFITKIRGTRGGGRFASETEAAKVRAENPKLFYGWYDMGEVLRIPIFAIYHARYKTRFVLCKFPVATSHQFVTFIPKIKLDDLKIKALLAFLNSSFVQYYIEKKGTPAAKGPIGLEVKIAKEIPVPDVRKLPEEKIEILAKKFEELENEARALGGASRKEDLELLKKKLMELDSEVAKALNIPSDVVTKVQRVVEVLTARRLVGAEEERPESVRGEYMQTLRPRTKRKRKREDLNMKLTSFR
ncbi:MAG: N-6 DNA methylase [Candidatus Methanomethyliales bacterium]|nr:N-6 DNA methylase [Candidatus Methanomethylicales archaeon]